MIFCDGLENPEGPVALPDGSWLVVEGSSRRGCITWISGDGLEKRVIAKTGRPNGLARDADGFIWVAESLRPALLRVSMQGSIEVVAPDCGGHAFLFPNDLCFGPDGILYMTDSGVNIEEFAPNNQVRADYKKLRYHGRVFRIDPASGQCTIVDDNLEFPNGIAFDRENNLYVNISVTGDVYRYRFSGGIVGSREYFGNVNDPAGAPGWRGPDGMAFSEDGRLFVAVFGQSDVTVLDTNGQIAERIKTRGKLPTNIAFGLPDTKRIYVTEYEHGAIESFDVAVGGLALRA